MQTDTLLIIAGAIQAQAAVEGCVPERLNVELLVPKLAEFGISRDEILLARRSFFFCGDCGHISGRNGDNCDSCRDMHSIAYLHIMEETQHETGN